MTQNLDIDDISTSRVSILTPCYNSAPYIPRFLNSLLAQAYKNLEIIPVNDGSTDKTAEVIKKNTYPVLSRKVTRSFSLNRKMADKAAPSITG